MHLQKKASKHGDTTLRIPALSCLLKAGGSFRANGLSQSLELETSVYSNMTRDGRGQNLGRFIIFRWQMIPSYSLGFETYS